MRQRIQVLASAVLFFALSPSAATASPRAECATPRASVMSWLASGAVESGGAEPCLDFEGAGVPSSERRGLAGQLKQVLDARGLWIDVEALPDTQEVEGNRVALHQGLPEVWLARKDGEWLVSAESVGQIGRLYDETFVVDFKGVVGRLPEFLRARYFGVAPWQILGLLLVVLLGLGAALVTRRLGVRYMARQLARRGEHASSATLAKAADPIGAMLAAFIVYHLLPALELAVRVNLAIVVALRLVTTTAGVLLAYRLVDVVSDVLAARAARTESVLDDQLVPLVRKSVKVIVACLGVIFVLQNLDVDVGSLIAGASLGGLAFTLAARDTVANLFGSVSIFADRPFQVGDWVVIDGKEGIVLEVGMRSTRIRTFYDSIITLPNFIVAGAAVDNFGVRRYRRQVFTLGVTYDTPPERVQALVEGIRAILRANPKVRTDQYEVHFRDFGASALEIFVYFFVRTDSWSDELAQRHNVLLEILRLARELDVSFAFPTQTLHVETMAPATPHPSRPARSEEELAAAILAFGPGGAGGRPLGAKLTHGFMPGSAAPRGPAEDEAK